MKKYSYFVFVVFLLSLLMNVASAEGKKSFGDFLPKELLSSSEGMNVLKDEISSKILSDREQIVGDIGIYGNNIIFATISKSDQKVQWHEYSFDKKKWLKSDDLNPEWTSEAVAWEPKEMNWGIIPNVIEKAQQQDFLMEGYHTFSGDEVVWKEETKKFKGTQINSVDFNKDKITVLMTNPEVIGKHFWYVTDGQGHFLESYVMDQPLD